MGLNFVQSKLSSFNGSGASTTATFTGNPVAGNLLIMGIRWTNTATISSLLDTNNNTWVQIGTTQTTGGIHCACYFAQSNLATHADTVTVNWSVNTASDGMVIAEYSNQLVTGALDGGPVIGSGATTSLAVGPVVASQANETIITIGSSNGGNTCSSGTLGQNVRQSGSTNNMFLMDLGETSPGSYSDHINQGTGQSTTVFLMTFFSTTSLSGGGNNGSGLLRLLGVN